MERYRRLRKLAPDRELLRRRVAGEPLRALAPDYGVSHTALGRYFARPEVAKQLREERQLLEAGQRAGRARRAAEQRLEREVRRKARQQAAHKRERARSARAARATRAGPQPARSAFAAFLDEQDARLLLTRADLYSNNDDVAARAVAAGGGIQEVIEATGLRTRENVLRLIDPAILTRALDNDAIRAAAAD